MSKRLKVTAAVLLLLIGVGAIYGGSQLILDPSGARLQMPLELLAFSPFATYFIPGIILFSFIGLGSLLVAFMLLSYRRSNPYLVLVQGSLLTEWIVVQICLISFASWLQLVVGVVGLALILIGFVLTRQKSRRMTA